MLVTNKILSFQVACVFILIVTGCTLNTLVDKRPLLLHMSARAPVLLTYCLLPVNRHMCSLIYMGVILTMF